MLSEAESASDNSPLPKDEDFSIVLGGPLYQILRRAHLSDGALLLVRQRVIAITLFAWLPLLLFTALEGTALSGSVATPFLLDLEVYTRLLIAMPLLIIAELVVHQRMRNLIHIFLERRIIPEKKIAEFHAAITSAFRLRDSIWAEVALVIFVYGVGILLLWRHYLSLDTNTWYAATRSGANLSPAGMWYPYVSLPIFQLILCRWCLRFFIWTRFLWRASRIQLSLVPTHPDRMGDWIPVAHGLRVSAGTSRPWRFAGWCDRQSHLLRRRNVDGLQIRNSCPRIVLDDSGFGAAHDVSAAIGRCKASGAS